jgi:hypothetical protein
MEIEGPEMKYKLLNIGQKREAVFELTYDQIESYKDKFHKVESDSFVRLYGDEFSDWTDPGINFHSQ